MMQQANHGSAHALRQMINGYQVSQAIHVAAVLGIADLLTEGPRYSDDLAAATGTHPATLYRLLRALASVGVFHEEGDRRFALTALGDCLRSDAQDAIGPWARFMGRPHHWHSWGDLLHSVRTGENAFRHVHGMSAWEYRAKDPQEEAAFDAAMTGLSQRHAVAVIGAYDFERFGCIVDVAGGLGAFLAAILTKHPATMGILFDQPRVVANAEGYLQAAGVVERCRVVGGDIFASLPDGGDAYVLKHILHDWEDEQATRILKVCRQAMRSMGTLVVIDRVIGPPNEAANSAFSDLTMLVMPGGKERTSSEWDALFASAGFRLVGVTSTGSEVSVIEGIPV